MNYQPHEYQQYATDFIIKNPTAAVFLEMGLGKSVIALTAILELCLERFEISRVLVIAPLRVARDTWPAEIQKWDHLKDLTYSVAVGTANERRAALRQKTFVHIINRENVQWLIEDSGIPWQYDMVVIDELSSFKSHQSKRFKSLMKARPGVRRMVGLTGTPSSNGLMDLWSEFRVLDMGKRLGRFITHYREQFFEPDRRNGMQVFSYRPRAGAEREIYRRIGDITISMRSADYLKMPECVMNTVPVKLDSTEYEVYEEMESKMVTELDGVEIDAVNAAALTGKLCQLANGAIYTPDGDTVFFHERRLTVFPSKAQRAGQMIAAFLDGNRRELPAAYGMQFMRCPKAQNRQRQRRRSPRHRHKCTRRAGDQHRQQRGVQCGKSKAQHKGVAPVAARRIHAAEQAGHCSNQHQRADETCMHGGHRYSPPREKESVRHCWPSSVSIASWPSCAYLSASGRPAASSIISRIEKQSPHSTRTISALSVGSAVSRQSSKKS